MNWDLLIKYINKEATAEEQLQVNEWLHEQQENKYLLQYLEKRNTNLTTELPADDIHNEWVRLQGRMFNAEGPSIKSRSLSPYHYLGIAASLILVSLLGWLFIPHGKTADATQQVTVKTPVNVRGKAVLPDGTLVYMAPNSVINYDKSFNVAKRVIHLSGEAFFDIRHNQRKPFVIYAQNNVAVTVLGTSFNVYSRKNYNAEVKVATGLVGVTANKHTQFLKAGQELSYQPQNKQTTITQVDAHDAASLQNETIYFKKSNANEIATKLQRWYNINVVVHPSARMHPLFSGEMKDNGISNLLKGLSYATGIKYQYQNSNTIILF